MWRWLHELDRILRGEATRPSDLRSGKIEIDAPGLTAMLLALACFYGFCMGWFALVGRDTAEFRQLVATMIKVPLLFFLTLVVTFPSLYVFNALVGSRLYVWSLLRLLLAALGVVLAVLASFGPIVAFFSLTTTNYPFMVLLNVLLFAVSGVLGLIFLLQTLHRLTIADQLPSSVAPPAAAPEFGATPEPAVAETAASLPRETKPMGALERLEGHILGRNVKTVFRCWVVVFALVGAQMSWVLRPFIGNLQQPFEWFRTRQSHFFEAVFQAWRSLFS